MKDGGQVGRQLVDFLTGLTQGKMDDGEFGLGFVGNGAPELICLARVTGSATTVPFLGLGIRPLGPRTLAYLASLGMSAGWPEGRRS